MAHERSTEVSAASITETGAEGDAPRTRLGNLPIHLTRDKTSADAWQQRVQHAIGPLGYPP
jgi:hypothetical protein